MMSWVIIPLIEFQTWSGVSAPLQLGGVSPYQRVGAVTVRCHLIHLKLPWIACFFYCRACLRDVVTSLRVSSRCNLRVTVTFGALFDDNGIVNTVVSVTVITEGITTFIRATNAAVVVEVPGLCVCVCVSSRK